MTADHCAAERQECQEMCRTAVAPACADGCGTDARSCYHEARNYERVCKRACPAGSQRRACRSGCRDQRRSESRACTGSAIVRCLDVCGGTRGLPTCGDGAVDPGETCDDGNTNPGDGCSARCEGEIGPCGTTERTFIVNDETDTWELVGVEAGDLIELGLNGVGLSFGAELILRNSDVPPRVLFDCKSGNTDGCGSGRSADEFRELDTRGRMGAAIRLEGDPPYTISVVTPVANGTGEYTISVRRVALAGCSDSVCSLEGREICGGELVPCDTEELGTCGAPTIECRAEEPQEPTRGRVADGRIVTYQLWAGAENSGGFTVEEGDTIALSLGNPVSGLDMAYTLRNGDPEAEALAVCNTQSGVCEDRAVSITGPPPYTLIVHRRHFGSDSLSDAGYTLSVRPVAGPVVRFTDCSPEIGCDTLEPLVGDLEDGQVHSYSVRGAQGDIVAIAIGSPSRLADVADPGFRLTNAAPGALPLAECPDGGPCGRLNVRLDGPAPYTLTVAEDASSAETGGRYNLSVRPVAGTITEETGCSQQLNCLSGESLGGTVDRGEIDTFRLAAAPGDEVSIEIASSPGGGSRQPSFQLTSRDWDGTPDTQLAVCDQGEICTATLRLEGLPPYTLNVYARGLAPTRNQSYTLKCTGGSDPPRCGDGQIDDAEQCDDGAGNSDTLPAACRTDCTNPRCGDGVVDSGETCEPPNAGTCDDLCQLQEIVCPDGSQSIPFDLNTWTVEQYEFRQALQADWGPLPDGTVVVQRNDSDASLYRDGTNLAGRVVEGTWRVGPGGNSDNDFVGFVFGYQARGKYYLFDWKREFQRQTFFGIAEMGMSLKVVDCEGDPTANDLWQTAMQDCVTTLEHNDLAWDVNTDYRFRLDFTPGEFTVEVRQGDALLQSWTIADSTYASGEFGFYNFSQEDVSYTGFATCPCGNGILDEGEECDDANAANGDGCDSACNTEACFGCAGEPSDCTPDVSGTLCPDDANVCTDDVCDGIGACTHPANAEPCDDAVYCNGADTCAGGSCSLHAGDPCLAANVECHLQCNEGPDTCADNTGTPCADDDNECTDDECDGVGQCAHPDNSDPCDDTVFCNGADTCAGGVCSIHAGNPCPGQDVGLICDDSCSELTDDCTAPDAAGTSCADDDEVCTDDACDGSGVCTHERDPQCPVACRDVLDFEEFAAGARVSATVGAEGNGPVGVAASNPNFHTGTNAAIVFDSSCTGACTGGDTDLGTPHRDFGGPGHGTGGRAGKATANAVPLGNILIAAEDLADGDGDGLIDDPDDQGGTSVSITIDFSVIGPVTAHELTLIDAELREAGGTATLLDGAGVELAVIGLPRTGNNGVLVTDLGAVPGVVLIEVGLNGSAAIDNVVFDVSCDDGDPATADSCDANGMCMFVQ